MATFRKGSIVYIIDRLSKMYGKSGKVEDVFIDTDDKTKVELDFGDGWCGYFNPNQLKTKHGKEIYTFVKINITPKDNEFLGVLVYKHRGDTIEIITTGHNPNNVVSYLYNYFNKLPKVVKI